MAVVAGCQKETASQDGEQPAGQETATPDAAITTPREEQAEPAPAPPPSPQESSAAQSGNAQAPQSPPALTPSTAEQSPMQQFREAQMRFQQVNARLSALAQQANEDEEVKKAREALETAALNKIKETTPNVQEDIDALQALGEKIQQSGEVGPGAGEPSEGTRKDIEEFQRQRQALGVLEQKALDDPQIQALRKEYEEKMMAALKEADPEAEQLLAEREQLSEQLQALQQRILQQQMQMQLQQQLQQQGQGQPAPQGEIQIPALPTPQEQEPEAAQPEAGAEAAQPNN